MLFRDKWEMLGKELSCHTVQMDVYSKTKCGEHQHVVHRSGIERKDAGESVGPAKRYTRIIQDKHEPVIK